jgi:hypothetical protein
MTRIMAWKCDVCGRTFYEGSGGYSANTSFTIELPSSGAYENNYVYTFSDMCLSCKNDLRNLLDGFIEDRCNKKDL